MSKDIERQFASKMMITGKQDENIPSKNPRLRNYNMDVMASDCITCSGVKSNTRQCKTCFKTKQNNNITAICSVLCIILLLTILNPNCSMRENQMQNYASGTIQDDGPLEPKAFLILKPIKQ